MKINTLLTSTMTLAVMLSACGGGGGSASPGTAQPQNSSSQVASSTLSTVAADFPYTITLLGTLDGDSYAVAINDLGQVTGNYLDSNGKLNAFIWQQGTMRSLVRQGQASDINNQGQVVGWRESNGQPEAFRYESDGRSYLLNTGGGGSRALAINEAGQAAGRLSNITEQAFVEDKGNLQIISGEINGYAVAMNNFGQVLVKEITDNGFRTSIWESGVLRDLGTLGGPCVQGEAINDAGQVVGWAQTADGDFHAFSWENGVMTDLASLVGNDSAAIAINNQGQILLKGSTLAGDHTFIYQNGQLTDLGNFGSSYAVATAINNNGQIVGRLATDNGAFRAFLATPKR